MRVKGSNRMAAFSSLIGAIFIAVAGGWLAEALSAELRPGMNGLTLERVAEGFQRPLYATHAGDGSGRLFIVEQAGVIRIVREGSVLPRPFLDITPIVGSRANEQGLLGLAFAPDYERTGHFFLNYTDKSGDSVVARYTVSDDPNRTDPNSARIVLTYDQPASNHNGGGLAFGPDGYLYISTGDGGGAGNPFRTAGDPRSLLGKLLRIDVAQLPYRIPAGNPFAGRNDARPEIWALGLRNPWRFAFDRSTGDLYIADVGQNQYEEVNRQEAGSRGGTNYGWSIMEGEHCFPAGTACNTSGLERPIVEYSHALGCSVTGGVVYRGARYPALLGKYLFGDYCSGRIWALGATGPDKWEMTELLQTQMRIASFGEDEAGEAYVVDHGGSLYRIAL